MCSIMGRSLAVWSNILFLLDQVPFELTPNAQIWPRNLNTRIGGTAGSIYLIVGNIGTKSGSGLDYTLGQVFLERFYSVYDTAHSRVGLARTRYTEAATN
jgi:cathepsin E